MADLVIAGAGGLGRETHEVAEDLAADGAPWRTIGFLDDSPQRQGGLVHGLPVLGPLEWLRAHADVAVVVAVGVPQHRARVVQRVLAMGHTRFATLVHPLARLGRRVKVGVGCVIAANTSMTTDIRIADHVTAYPNCFVGHDATVGDFTTLHPNVNVCGDVHVAEGCYLGAGSTIIQQVRVGRWAIVGAGATVVREVDPNTTVVGVPARAVKRREEGWHLE